MIKNFTQEIILSVLLILVLFLLVNPAMVLMPSQMEMVVIGVFAVVYFGYATLVWKEKGGDERDEAHRMFADRISFILGSLVLFVGVLYGALMHEVNLWLVFALGAMILSKILVIAYLRLKN